ncbi:hypothetical protein [Chitinophaga rhizophila]|uniref:Uncharacterized protein n=1 Tax=Chitinophaga rhizophila TaxID=2866212 RepID=A0ABS7GCA6_9BACT|nr:hypothetical protein [Chitinophaga rhizophila]MBW8685315.1 hypothetical protein [Chitinophaga rhizophila]
MAIQTSILTFTGQLGTMIGYRRKGKYFTRSVPQSVRQTAATRHAAIRFGIASQKAALIRHAFCPMLDVHNDKAYINQLNKVLIGATGNTVSSITGFRFNQHTGMNRFFKVLPVLTADSALHIPAQTITTRKGVTALEVKVMAARISFATRQVIGRTSTTILINASQPFDGASIPCNIPGIGTLLATVQVRAMCGDTVSGNVKDAAADIAGVLEPVRLPAVQPTFVDKSHLRITEDGMLDYNNYSPATGAYVQRE